jgi:porin
MTGMKRSWYGAALVLGLLLTWSCQAIAKDEDEDPKPADPDTGESTLSEKTLKLLPNPWERFGIKFAATYVGEILGNASGGIRQGAAYEGRLNLAVDVDFGKRAGLPGLSFHANVFQIHGNGLSREYVGNLMLASGIEALPTTRLYELWLEQKFANNKVAVRVGQLAADTEFINSNYAGAFINSTFGWPVIAAIDLPAGGPSPPLAVPGIRVRFKATDEITVLAAIFNGDSAGPGPGDAQERNRYGLNFRLGDPPLMIGEVQYAYNKGKGSAGLPGTLKFGGWYHTGSFDDQRFTAQGASLADPSGSGVPARLRGNFGLYGVIDQSVYQFGGSSDRDIGVFARLSTSPSDRNLIDFYADGGVTFNGPFEKRPNDKFGVGFAFARISNRTSDLDLDFQAFTATPRAIRDYEALLAVTYLAEVRDGWTVHPTFQYVMHPNGGAFDPTESSGGTPLKNAAVFAVRSIMKF